MANLSKTTRDRQEIQRWAEERGGKPSHVKSTGSETDIGILRIDFPGYSGQGSLEEISWDEFFDKFDERGLSLIYQEETADGERSNFNKLVSAETAEEKESGSTKSSGGRSGSRKKSTSSAKKSTSKKSTGKKATAKKVATRGAAGQKASSSKKAATKKKTAPAKKTAAKKKNTARKNTVKKGATKKRR